MKATRNSSHPINVREDRPPVRQSPVVAHLLAKYDGRIPVQMVGLAAKHDGPITVADIDRWAETIPDDAPRLEGNPTGFYRSGYKIRDESVIYYLLFNGLVKIGTSQDLRTRMQAIPHDELLATEPGGYSLEKIRHSEFRALHYRGEWFRYEGPLVDHVARLRAG